MANAPSPPPLPPPSPCVSKLESLCMATHNDTVKCGQCAGLHATALKAVGCTHGSRDRAVVPPKQQQQQPLPDHMVGNWIQLFGRQLDETSGIV